MNPCNKPSMKLKLILLLTLLNVLCSNAATRVEAWVSITNTPVGNTQTLVWNSSMTRTWTNSAGDASTQIQTTNSIRNARTNLQNQLSSYLFTNGYAITYGTNTNDVIIYGLTNAPFTITIGGLWASVAYYTNTVYGASAYTVPYIDYNSNTYRIFQQSHIITNFDYSTQKVSSTSYPFTNFPHSMRTDNPAFTNLSTFGGTNQPTDFLATNGGMRNVWASNLLVTNLTGTILSATLTSNTDTNGTYTNALRLNVNILLATNTTLLGGSASNMVLTNLTWLNGVLGGLTNGQLVNTFLTNIQSAQITNLNAYGGTLSNIIAHTLVATNLSSPGTGSQSEKLGSGSISSGTRSVAFGVSASATNSDSVAIGYGATAWAQGAIVVGAAAASDVYGLQSISIGSEAVAAGTNSIALGALAAVSQYHENSIALGKGAATTETNQIMMGTSVTKVTIPGRLEGGSITNSSLKGTNAFEAKLTFVPRSNTGLANGFNSGIVLGSNAWIKLSGPTAAYTNVGFSSSGVASGDRYLVHFDNPGLSVSVRHDSGLDATAANRVYTGTGAELNSTNNPAVLDLIYDGAVSRWRVNSFR